MNRQGIARQNHYLPQFYQLGFADESGCPWVYDRKDDAYRQLPTKRTGVEKDLYTTMTPEGHQNDEVERMLADKIDGPTKAIIERLDDKDMRWEGEDRWILALFVALMRTRTPAFDKEQKEFGDKLLRWVSKKQNPTPEAFADAWLKATGEVVEAATAKRAFDVIQNDQYDVDIPRQNIIKMMLELSLELAEALMTLNWTILSIPNACSFITCDHPFVVIPPVGLNGDLSGYGIRTAGATTAVPLSSRSLICFHESGHGIGYRLARRDEVRYFNAEVATNSERFVLARDRPLLESVVRRTNLAVEQARPRLQFEAI
ncbi:DUF4238 domain-containing protein [Paludibaculum fermentans]|uniref:DUF4238 domain-containing protein n=1 Tax=Paludibaculum fermentans TaxID=1473598 RepID=UPI003EB815A6